MEKLHIDFIRSYIKNYEFELLSDFYLNNNEKR
jgi:hypothetical protein